MWAVLEGGGWGERDGWDPEAEAKQAQCQAEVEGKGEKRRRSRGAGRGKKKGRRERREKEEGGGEGRRGEATSFIYDDASYSVGLLCGEQTVFYVLILQAVCVGWG